MPNRLHGVDNLDEFESGGGIDRQSFPSEFELANVKVMRQHVVANDTSKACELDAHVVRTTCCMQVS